MSAGTLTYMDRKGAGVCRRGELSELAKRMKTLRCPATLRADGHEEPIGGIDKFDGADDGRIKWQWWYDATIVESK